jgi:hypothetical protein
MQRTIIRWGLRLIGTAVVYLVFVAYRFARIRGSPDPRQLVGQ